MVQKFSPCVHSPKTAPGLDTPLTANRASSASRMHAHPLHPRRSQCSNSPTPAPTRGMSMPRALQDSMFSRYGFPSRTCATPGARRVGSRDGNRTTRLWEGRPRPRAAAPRARDQDGPTSIAYHGSTNKMSPPAWGWPAHLYLGEPSGNDVPPAWKCGWRTSRSGCRKKTEDCFLRPLRKMCWLTSRTYMPKTSWPSWQQLMHF